MKTVNKGQYAVCKEYRLFLLSDIYSNEEMRKEALEVMINISEKYGIIFDEIMVLVPGSLYIFNLKQRDCQVKSITSEKQFQMSCLAREMVAESME